MSHFEEHKELINKLESVYITPREEASRHREAGQQSIKFPEKIYIPEYHDWDKVKEIKPRKKPTAPKEKVPSKEEKPQKDGTRNTIKSGSRTPSSVAPPTKSTRERVWDAGHKQ